MVADIHQEEEQAQDEEESSEEDEGDEEESEPELTEGNKPMKFFPGAWKLTTQR
jgi:hypothetical protein